MKRNRTFVLAVTIFVLTVVAACGALQCPDCDVSDAKRDEYDRALNLTLAEQRSAESKHLAYGLPRAAANATHEDILHQKDYLIWYDSDLRVPLWVGYKITRGNITNRVSGLNVSGPIRASRPMPARNASIAPNPLTSKVTSLLTPISKALKP